MPKFVCECGNVISYSEIPCPGEWLFVSDVEFDEVHGTVDAEDVYKRMRSFFECRSCRRLWIFWRGFRHPPTEYVKQDDASPDGQSDPRKRPAG